MVKFASFLTALVFALTAGGVSLVGAAGMPTESIHFVSSKDDGHHDDHGKGHKKGHDDEHHDDHGKGHKKGHDDDHHEDHGKGHKKGH